MTANHLHRQAEPIDSKRPYTVSPAVVEQRRLAAVKHGAYAKETEYRQRQRRLRQRVLRLRREFPVTKSKPDLMVYRYAELEAISSALSNHIAHHGVVNEDGEVSRAVAEYRYLVAEMRKLGEALGIMPGDGSGLDSLSSLLTSDSEVSR